MLDKDQSNYNYLERFINDMTVYQIVDQIQTLSKDEYILKAFELLPSTFPEWKAATLLFCLDKESNKLKAIDIFESKITNPSFLKASLYKLDNPENQAKVIDKYKDKYKKEPNVLLDLLTAITTNQVKARYLGQLSLPDQVKLICSMEDDSVKKVLIEQEKYKSKLPELLSTCNDLEFVIKMFNKQTDDYLKQRIFEKIADYRIKQTLINYVNFPNYIKFKKRKENFELISSNVKEIDNDITLGVELECCNEEIAPFYNEIFLKDFRITKDSSLTKGIEFISPILNYTNKDISKLKTVCDILKETKFYTDEHCGGHIHLGSDYFDTVEEFKTFLYIYLNTENIFFQISQRPESIIRANIYEYARPLTEPFTAGMKKFNYNIKNLYTWNHLMYSTVCGNRYYAINLTNLGNIEKNTIEFRLPNGEIDFDELDLNIRLYLYLLKASKSLVKETNKDKKAMLEALSNNYNEITKLQMLYQLLNIDTEDALRYQERYNTNSDLNGPVTFKQSFKF